MILNGTDLRVYVDEVLVAFARNNTLSINSDFIEVSGQGNGYFKENLPSLLSWSVSVDLLVDLTENTGLPSLFELITERTRFRLQISADADSYYYVGMAYLSSLEVSAPNEDATTLSVEVMPDGILERLPVDQLNFTITEAGIIYNNLLRLNKENVLIVSGQDTNQITLIQNGRAKVTQSFAADVVAVCAVGNNFLVCIDQSGSNNILIDSSGNYLQIWTSSTAPTDRDVFAVFYKNAIYSAKTTQYVIKYVDYVQDAAYNLGGADTLGQLTVNKYGVFVINTTDTSVQKIDSAGIVTTFLDVASTDYVAIASDDDYLYIARVLAGNLSILCYLDSTLKWTYSAGTYSACSLYADNDRNLYICLTGLTFKVQNKTVESSALLLQTFTNAKTTAKDLQVSPTGALILASGVSVSGITFQIN